MAWWIIVDFGSDHRIAEADTDDSPGDEWDGPYMTFGEARDFLVSIGVEEARLLQRKNQWWRRVRLHDPVVERSKR